MTLIYITLLRSRYVGNFSLKHCRNIPRRTNSGGSLKGPSPHNTVWERQAIAVKNTDIEKSAYLDAIRAEHDPSLHIKTIEDELKGTIGKALGRQGEKVTMYINLMKQEKRKYEEIIRSIRSDSQQSSNSALLLVTAKSISQKYNEFRKSAIQARWELMVHRQAVGFIVNNHKHVVEHFPIDDAIDENAIPNATTDLKDYSDSIETCDRDYESNGNKTIQKTACKDQSDWWYNIGRWK